MATRVKIVPWLLLQLMARRVDWITLSALIVCLVGASLRWLVLPQIEQRTRTAAMSLADDPTGRRRLDDESFQTERYRAFQNRLVNNGERSELLKTVFSEAAAAGIPLAQGDYTLVADAEGGYDRLQIILPLKGSYTQIRSFAKALLEKLPPLSLDEITFRRDHIKSPTVEARLRLTLYLNQTR